VRRAYGGLSGAGDARAHRKRQERGPGAFILDPGRKHAELFLRAARGGGGSLGLAAGGQALRDRPPDVVRPKRSIERDPSDLGKFFGDRKRLAISPGTRVRERKIREVVGKVARLLEGPPPSAVSRSWR
jgi:hypothetical protein